MDELHEIEDNCEHYDIRTKVTAHSNVRLYHHHEQHDIHEVAIVEGYKALYEDAQPFVIGEQTREVASFPNQDVE